MKIFFTFLIVLIIQYQSIACSAAYQYSLFPLGSSMGQVIILEVELDRYLDSPANKMMQIGGRGHLDNTPAEGVDVRWKGTLKLYTLQDGALILHQDLGTIDIRDANYNDALLPYFQKAYDIATQMPMFEEAILESVGYCHHDRTCSFMTLTIDEENVKFYASSNEESYKDKKCPVPFSQKTLLKVEMATQIKFTDFQNIEKEYQVDFFRLWSPLTVRRYKIGEQTVQIFSLGRGDKSRYLLGKEENWKSPNLENIASYIDGNDVLFHGQRFDFLQVF